MGIVLIKLSAKTLIACVASGIVGAREIKFWRRSRQKRAAKPREIRRYFKVPLPILLAASPLACRLRCQNFNSRALTIPLATQAKTLSLP